MPDGRGGFIRQRAFMGAEGRYEDYTYLRLMEREWRRPVSGEDSFSELPASERPSPRASIVILFWSYFETRVERLMRGIWRSAPTRLLDDALNRYVSVGSRLDRFYRISCDSTYFADLRQLGHERIAEHLAMVQIRRNEFAHGKPQAIDEALVRAVVESLKLEHEAWIAVFNYRASAHRPVDQR